MRSRVAAGLVVVALLAQLLLVPVAAQTGTPGRESRPEPDPRFGIVSAFWLPEEAAALNLGWERILFYWSQIQPNSADDWNTLHVMEEWLEEADAQGRKVVGLLKNTPAWATDTPSDAGVPRGLYLPVDDPDNLWAAYVRRIGEYYGPRGVHNWIIWNEPDIDPGVYGTEWLGSVEDYYQLVKVAYLVMKEVDPEATIHLAGLTYWHDVVAGRDQYLQRFLRVATADPEAAENDYFFDVISLHIYFRTETVPSIVEQIDAIQNEFGIDKPIWINETNAAPTEDPEWPVSRPQFQLDLEQQAWYIAQAHALGFAAGAESIGIYKFFDVNLPPGEESFGLIRADETLRPGYYAHQTTIRALQGFTAATAEREADHYVVTFRQPRGTTRVMWARREMTATVSIPARLPSAELWDVMGEVQQIEPTNGVYTITLEGARCEGECLVGGPPLFLVERLPEPTPTPSPTPTSTSTPTPTATATATATPEPSATPEPTATPAPVGSDDATAEGERAVGLLPFLNGRMLGRVWWLIPGGVGLLLVVVLLWRRKL